MHVDPVVDFCLHILTRLDNISNQIKQYTLKQNCTCHSCSLLFICRLSLISFS